MLLVVDNVINTYNYPIYCPSFCSESVQTLFFDKSAGRARKIWSGDESNTLEIIGASLSKPHTALHCKLHVCMPVYLLVYIWPYTENLNRTNRNEGTRTLQIWTRAKAFQCSVWWMWQRTPHHVTQCRWIYWVRETDCIWSERKGLLLDCSVSTKDNRSEGDQSGPR